MSLSSLLTRLIWSSSQSIQKLSSTVGGLTFFVRSTNHQVVKPRKEIDSTISQMDNPPTTADVWKSFLINMYILKHTDSVSKVYKYWNCNYYIHQHHRRHHHYRHHHQLNYRLVRLFIVCTKRLLPCILYKYRLVRLHIVCTKRLLPCILYKYRLVRLHIVCTKRLLPCILYKYRLVCLHIVCTKRLLSCINTV